MAKNICLLLLSTWVYLAIASKICILEQEDDRVIDAESGCADIAVVLPVAFSELRVDEVEYKLEGDKCVGKASSTQQIPCSLEQTGSGQYIAKATVCDVETHTWIGWNVGELMHDSRFAFSTAYFSQGGKWSNIQKHCIQANQTGPAHIYATDLDSVEIKCVKHPNCPQGPFTTIFSGTKDLCYSYQEPKCSEETLPNEDLVLSVILERPGERYSNVFCSTGDAFFSYVVDWGQA